MTQEWGKQLKKFRLRTGLSQNEFSDAISDMVMQFDEGLQTQLKENNIENVILSNSELSRYETGKRVPRYRSRFVTLVLMLVRLGGIESLEEANEWLGQADQSPLTEKEVEIIFKDPAESESRSFGQVLTETLTEDQPVGLTMPQFAMWSSLLAIVIILLGVIYFLLTSRPVEPDAITALREETAKVEPVAVAEVEPEQGADVVETEVEAEPTEEITQDEEPQESLVARQMVISDFANGNEDWQSFEAEENMQMISAETEALCTDIAEGGGYLWAMRLWREEIPVDANTRYRLTMDVTSSVDRNITVLLAHTDLFKWYMFSVQEIKIGTQTIEIEFNQHVSDPTASVSLLLGGQAPGELCFDNLVLEEIGTFEVEPVVDSEPVADNMLNNEAIHGGWFESWGFHPFQEPVYTLHFDNSSVCFAIEKYVDHLGQINFYQEPIALTTGQEYLISFEANASAADAIDVNVIIGDAVNEVWTLSEGEQTVEYRFMAKADLAEEAFLVHLSGPDGSEVCFRNFVLAPEG